MNIHYVQHNEVQ